jgi:hypothetical protein
MEGRLRPRRAKKLSCSGDFFILSSCKALFLLCFFYKSSRILQHTIALRIVVPRDDRGCAAAPSLCIELDRDPSVAEKVAFRMTLPVPENDMPESDIDDTSGKL